MRPYPRVAPSTARLKGLSISWKILAAFYIAALLLLVLVGCQWERVIDVRAGGVRITVRDLAVEGQQPTVGWLGTDSCRIYVGFVRSEASWTSGEKAAGEIADVCRNRVQHDVEVPQKFPWGDRFSFGGPFHVRLTGIVLPIPRAYSDGNFLFATRIGLELHDWGIQTLTRGTGKHPRILERRLVWNVTKFVGQQWGLSDPRGRMTGCVSRNHGDWEVWLWPEGDDPVAGGSQVRSASP